MPQDESNDTVPDIALRPIDIDDWPAAHELASTLEACRYQAWGPNTPGTAIARALLGIAFESMNLHRVAATCDPRNLASAAVLQKVGMTFEGQLRHTMQIRDGWRDSSVFSVLANEWPALPA
ncbi:MAG TPA: GNAT family protein [Propionibacteriaceae bacterium]